VLDRLRSSITGALATAFDLGRDGVRFADGGMASAHVPNYEAYAELMQAIDAEIRSSDLRGELEHERRAVALDSSFVLPLLWATFAYAQLGDLAHADSVANLADKRRDQLGPDEQATLEWERADLRGDNVAALRAAREWARISPRSEPAAWTLAYSAARVNRPRE
jgi:hypothetical protein